jgi:hypothetical protein
MVIVTDDPDQWIQGGSSADGQQLHHYAINTDLEMRWIGVPYWRPEEFLIRSRKHAFIGQ